MTGEDDEFRRKLLTTFRIEAEEHVEAISAALLELEKTAENDRARVIERILREVHSMKGAARAVNRTALESLCQSLEEVLAALIRGAIDASPALLDLLHESTGAMRMGISSGAELAPAKTEALTHRLDQMAGGSVAGPRHASTPRASRRRSSPEDAANIESVTPAGAGTIRIQLEKLDSVMRQTEELFAPRLATSQRVAELREAGVTVAKWKSEQASLQPVRSRLERLLTRMPNDRAASAVPELAKILEYLEAEGRFLGRIEEQLANLLRSSESDRRTLAGTLDRLLLEVKEMQMLPFSSLFELLPRVTRDLAHDQAKQVNLVTSGGEIQIDRKILDEIKDPLIHLLRNSVDHGIETPQRREEKRKPPHGTVSITVSHENTSNVQILMADDGAGIDVENVKETAIRLGFASREEINELDEQEALALVFRSGFSTSPIITQISGRGLGLAIVREKIDRLGGVLTLENRAAGGTLIRMVLPLTLVTFRGLLVDSGGRPFIIPTASVDRVVRIPIGEVRTLENRETIRVARDPISLVWLSDILEVSRQNLESVEHVQAVVLEHGGDRIAFRVDAVVDEQEIMVKELGRQLARVRNVSGASVLGTGEVVPVLNVPDLMRSARRIGARTPPLGVERPAEERRRRSILIVEDSITSRALLKNIFESVGYAVTTAVDGIDAYTALKSGSFDLIVSDVEMPRMDGFELTAKVRADERFSKLPVVLVTALESREHREHGIDVGANAYVVKSSFDQSNLLEVVRLLL